MPTTPALESISIDALSTITGGCGGKRKNCCPPQAQPPQAAPAAPAAPSGPLVSTNVSVTGYGAPTTATV
ncbi:MAG: hypothetical protein ABI175_02760 [Polyangiales bacterium]